MLRYMTMCVLQYPVGARLDFTVVAVVASAMVMCPSATARAGFRNDVGFTQLSEELGTALPTGAGIPVSQIEAPKDGNYAPEIASGQFSGKEFSFQSGSSGTSTHANGMAQRFYGNTISIAPGVTDVHLYNADHWVGSGSLNTGLPGEPLVETQLIQNHSWVGKLASTADSVEALQRLDFAIQRDGFLALVGMDNGASQNALPELLSQSYNTLSVGRTDGNHSHGLTSLNGAGRVKPELVAPPPSESASRATARVSSAAAVLLESAQGTQAVEPQVMKAILMAGATKDEFGTDWQRKPPADPDRPLDDVFGAGELNIYRSYHILAAGRQAANDAVNVAATGWDYEETDTDGRFYFFEVPPGQRATEFSAILNWHADVQNGNDGFGFVPEVSLWNMDLALYASNGFSATALLDSSASQVDNVEHIYFNESLGMGQSLGPGQYMLEVISPVDDVDYGLAWFGSLEVVMGDMDLDGDLDFDDVQFFIEALQDPEGYEAAYGVAPEQQGNFDGDSDFDFDDIAGFVSVLASEADQAAAAAPFAAPEPSCVWLAIAAAALLAGYRAARTKT